jgi:ElaB/YqjD/DUF883 family membrane-anchored ribosome-binding protein
LSQIKVRQPSLVLHGVVLKEKPMNKQIPAEVVQDLHDQIDALLDRVKDTLKDTGHDAEDAAARAAFSVMEAARALAFEARLRSGSAVREAAKSVRKHPVAATAALSAAVAALAGVIVIGRRHDDAEAA